MALNFEDFLMGAIGLPKARQTAELPPAPAPGTAAPIEDEIVVTGTSPRGPEAPAMGNADYLRKALEASEMAPERKGMFGTKGTLRDILGVVGDAFLVQSGNKAVYAPQREREQMADAVTGFTNGEEAAMAAIERLNAAGFGEQALELQKNLEAQKLRVAQQESLGANRDSLIEGRKRDAYIEARQQLAQLYSSPSAKKNPALAHAQALRIAQNLNVDPLQLGLGPNLSAEEMAIIGESGFTPYQQRSANQREVQLGISQQNADTNRDRADRPPAPRSPRAQTELEYFQEIGNIPENRRTPAQKAFYDKYTRSGRSGGGRSGRPDVQVPASTNERFR